MSLSRHPYQGVTRFEYDGLSQVTKRIDANGYSLSYQYDKERNLTGLINENGEVYRFEYDGRLNETPIATTSDDFG